MRQDCLFSLYYFDLYEEYILREAGPEEDECGFEIGRSASNPDYGDDTTLLAENTRISKLY